MYNWAAAMCQESYRSEDCRQEPRPEMTWCALGLELRLAEAMNRAGQRGSRRNEAVAGSGREDREGNKCKICFADF